MSVEHAQTMLPPVLPPVIRAAVVNRPVREAFAVFTEEIGAWWPLPTHGLFGDRSGAVTFRDQQLIEQSVDGSEAVWAEVLVWHPPERLVLAWHPGRDAAQASEVEISFEPDGAGTRVIIEHRGWESFGTDAADRRLGYVGPNAWGYVLDHYADGAEVAHACADLGELRAAYDEFFAEAERGGFGPATDGGWNAEQVVAHVALNDVAILGVCQALVHQNLVRFENQTCQDPAVLSSFIHSVGDLAALVERGRTVSRLVQASLQRLSAEQLATEVPCHLTHDGEVMADRPIEWQSIAITTQAGMHLPAHVQQLRNLRP